MPLTKAQFAALVRSMPGASDNDIMAAAKKAESVPSDSFSGFLSDLASGVLHHPLDTLGGFIEGAKAPAVDALKGLGDAALGFGQAITTPPEMQAQQLAQKVAFMSGPPSAGDVVQAVTGVDPKASLARKGGQALGGLLLAHGLEPGMPKAPVAAATRVAEDVAPVAAKPSAVLPDAPPVQRMAGDVPPEFHSVERGFTDPTQFTNPDTSPLTNGSPYAILTAANPGGQALSHVENATRMAQLAKDLQAKGVTPIQQFGVYDGKVEPSVLAPGLSVEDAKALGQKYNQDAVITHEGWHRLADDKTFPRVNASFDQTAPDYYSVIDLPGHGPVKYQMQFPDEAFAPAPSAAPEAPVAAPQTSADASGKGEPSSPQSTTGSTVRLYRGESSAAQPGALAGQTFTDDPLAAVYYAKQGGGAGKTYYLDLPADEAAKYRTADATGQGVHILPPELADAARQNVLGAGAEDQSIIKPAQLPTEFATEGNAPPQAPQFKDPMQGIQDTIAQQGGRNLDRVAKEQEAKGLIANILRKGGPEASAMARQLRSQGMSVQAINTLRKASGQ